jgi:hypothetical protein
MRHGWGKKKNASRLAVEKSDGRRVLRTTRCRLGNNIELDVRQIESEIMDWTNLAYSRDQWKVRCKHKAENFKAKVDAAVVSSTRLYSRSLLLSSAPNCN